MFAYIITYFDVFAKCTFYHNNNYYGFVIAYTLESTYCTSTTISDIRNGAAGAGATPTEEQAHAQAKIYEYDPILLELNILCSEAYGAWEDEDNAEEFWELVREWLRTHTTP
jgi:hypothetical protein